ncbi:hypothetical protein BJF78_30110 [Pseudonocardia sp. CNS-139]|nr:hypothetical protein BJF78_30110 [Pseudonocardia sp. CNS-139]
MVQVAQVGDGPAEARHIPWAGDPYGLPCWHGLVKQAARPSRAIATSATSATGAAVPAAGWSV